MIEDMERTDFTIVTWIEIFLSYDKTLGFLTLHDYPSMMGYGWIFKDWWFKNFITYGMNFCSFSQNILSHKGNYF